MSNQPVKIITNNRKAHHNFVIEDSYEAGVVLLGSEIKSIRAGQINIGESYALFQGGELWLHNAHISPYKPASRENHEPRRERKLLLHRRQLNRLQGQLQQKGFTLIPLKVYLKHGLAKVELGLARGKKLYDKRESLKKRQDERLIERALAKQQKGEY